MRRATLFIALLSLAASATAAMYFGMREIHKDSELAALLDIPRRGEEWTLQGAGNKQLLMPSQRGQLADAVPGERLADISTLIELRDVNIDAMRRAARQLEEMISTTQFMPAYGAPATAAVVALPESREVDLMAAVLHAIPPTLKVIAIASPGDSEALAAALRSNGVTATVVEAGNNPHSSSVRFSKAPIADAIYPVRARNGSPLLAYTLFHQWARDLSWPDASYLDDVASATGISSVRMPLAGSSSNILLARGKYKDLFIAESVFREEMAKRERLLLPRPTRAGLLEVYKRTFSADRVFPVEVGHVSLSSYLLFTADGNAAIPFIHPLDQDRKQLAEGAFGRLWETLTNAGYMVHIVPTTAAQILDGRSPLAGPFFYDRAKNRKTLILPVTSPSEDLDAVDALARAGVHVVPVIVAPKYGAVSRYVATL